MATILFSEVQVGQLFRTVEYGTGRAEYRCESAPVFDPLNPHGGLIMDVTSRYWSGVQPLLTNGYEERVELL